MKIHRLAPGGSVQSTEQDVADVPAQLIVAIGNGECTFIDGAWLFSESIWTTTNPSRPVSELRMVALVVPKTGEPGSCDLHLIEAWDADEMVLRSGCAIAEGIDVVIPAATSFGEAPPPHLSVVPA